MAERSVGRFGAVPACRLRRGRGVTVTADEGPASRRNEPFVRWFVHGTTDTTNEGGFGVRHGRPGEPPRRRPGRVAVKVAVPR
jgi:hypothetical protein